MRVEVVAVGTELLLGQIADTNGAWIGQRLALAGLDSHFHQAVGDNHDRIVLALRTALARSDAVVVCGGLGPTHDDVTREALASVLHVPLRRDPTLVARIEALFAARGRAMPASNLRQADVPEGAVPIEQTIGTAPGLICPVGNKVVYALPGVPYELADMFDRAVLPDLARRRAEAGDTGTIVSRVVRTWGLSESGLGELLAPRIAELDRDGRATIALLASGIEGIKVRITVKAPDPDAARAVLDAEEAEVRRLVGDAVFGVDDETMETAVADLLRRRGDTLAVAESLTGGLAAARLVAVPGASSWFRGGVVSYAAEVKHHLLGVPAGPVVTEEAAMAMAAGVRTALGATVGLATTGVAGPDPAEDLPPGTVFVGVAAPGEDPWARRLQLGGDRDRVRQLAVISALDLLRRSLRRAVGADR
jgi:nicotinamide-nucleotide amidase